MLYSKFLFHLNLERSLQCIQVILDANLPFGIAPYIIFAPCSTEVIAVFSPFFKPRFKPRA